MAATAVEVYFVERFVRLAKPGGWIAMIVPESILSSDQLSPLRQWVLTQARMYAVIGLPQKVFTGVGANARTGIVFLRRLTAAESRPGARRRRHNVLMGNPHDDRPGYLSDYLAGVLAELASLKSARK
jgi:type I restriction-modification system DNA methylase subunit